MHFPVFTSQWPFKFCHFFCLWNVVLSYMIFFGSQWCGNKTNNFAWMLFNLGILQLVQTLYTQVEKLSNRCVRVWVWGSSTVDQVDFFVFFIKLSTLIPLLSHARNLNDHVAQEQSYEWERHHMLTLNIMELWNF